MIITYHGGQSFKVVFGDTTLALNPASKQSKKYNPAKFGSNVALVSLWHPDYNGVEHVSLGDKRPFVIDGPGEYEVGSITVRGHEVPVKYGGKDLFNTIYQVRMEDMNLVFLGALSDPELVDPKTRADLGEVDILFLPISGGDLLEVPQASKLAVQLEARLIIPMEYDDATLKAFLKEEGSTNLSPQDKLTIKKREVASMSGEVVVLKSLK